MEKQRRTPHQSVWRWQVTDWPWMMSVPTATVSAMPCTMYCDSENIGTLSFISTRFTISCSDSVSIRISIITIGLQVFSLVLVLRPISKKHRVMWQFGAFVFHTVVRWHKLSEVENECTLHNSIVLTILMPKIIKVNENFKSYHK